MLFGRDVSNNNSQAVVLSAINDPGVSFVIFKATEGTGFVDGDHDAWVAAARSQHKLVGHYHFAQPAASSGAAQADFFLAHAKPEPGDVVALDLETSGITPATTAGFAADFLGAVKAATGASPWLYVNGTYRYLTGGYTALRTYPLWFAAPGQVAGSVTPAPWPVLTAHQYGTVGALDADAFMGDAAAWLRLAVPMPTKTATASTAAPIDLSPHPMPDYTVVFALNRDVAAAAGFVAANALGVFTASVEVARTAMARGRNPLVVVGQDAVDALAIPGTQTLTGVTRRQSSLIDITIVNGITGADTLRQLVTVPLQ